MRRLPILLLAPAAVCFLTPNPLLTLYSIIVAVVLPLLLWRQGEPPVLLFCCAIQWLQTTTVLHYANFAGADLVAAFGGDELQRAVALGLTGLIVLAGGIRLGMGQRKPQIADRAEAETLQCSAPLAFGMYFVSLVASAALRIVADRIAQLTQPLLAIATMKWIFLFILCFTVLQSRRGHFYLWLAVLIEFFVGLLGYFSTFKNVFFLLIVVMLASRNIWNLKRIILGVAVCLVLIITSIMWSAIKQDYRDFLNQGSQAQETVVPVSARVEKLQDLVTGLTDEGFFRGVDALIARVGYVTYFALTIGTVPDHIPYERGQLWIGAVKHVLMPRLFFPGKPVIDDSARTSYYTGVMVAGEDQGASISMGYMAESYVDFGPVGMFLPIGLLGMFYGFIYRWLVFRSRFKMFGFASATAILLFSAYNFETSNVKIIGGVLTCLLIGIGFLIVAERPAARFLGLRET